MLCAPVFKTVCDVRLLSASTPIDGKGMTNFVEGESKLKKLIMDLVLKIVRLLFFPDEIFHSQFLRKVLYCPLENFPKCSVTGDLARPHRGAADQDETALIKTIRFSTYYISLKYNLNEYPVHRA